MSPKFDELLDPEKKKQLDKMRAKKRRKKKKPRSVKPEQPKKENLTTRDFEQMMRGDSYRRGRGGAIKQIRHK